MKNLISAPLLKENLKRFWGFGAVVFMCYFFTTTFIIITNYKHLEPSTVNAMLKMSFPTYWFFGVILPIVSAVIVFSYLSKVNSTTVMHTLPFSRRSLFVTNYLSGLILCLVPAIINFVTMAAIKMPVYMPFDSSIDIFTNANVFKIMVSNAVTIFFVYSVSVLGGMFCGNSIIHLLTALAMNFTLPLLYLTTIAWSYLFLYGFVEGNSIWDIVIKMHPVFLAAEGTWTFNLAECMLYSGIALVLSILAYFFYQKRALERAGDSYVFGFIKYIIAFIFTYVPATGMAMLLSELSGGSIIVGLAIGGVVGFIIGWMIINKNFKIFNLNGLVTMLCCLALTAVVLLGFKIDFLGFEKKVPNEKDIASISYDCSYTNSNYVAQTITDEDNIKRLTNIHKEIVDLGEPELIDGTETTWFNINYTLKNGKEIRRFYSALPASTLAESKDVKELFESSEVTRFADELKFYDSELSYFRISSLLPYATDLNSFALEPYDSEATKIKSELIDALIKDINSRTFEQIVADNSPLGMIDISIEIPKDKFNESINNGYLNTYPSYDANGQETYMVESFLDFYDDYDNFLYILEKYDILSRIKVSN